MSFLKRAFIILAIPLILYGFYLNAYSVLHGELNFFNDVARDFLLLRELDQKKIVLIGPRANNAGLFHGPLWTYINYPAFVLGHGNPVIVGWYWIFLLFLCQVSGFFIVKKYFSTPAAVGFVVLLLFRLVSFMNGLFHSLSNFLFVPAFFYTIHEYLTKKKLRFLIFHLVLTCMIIQLNIGVGGSMAVLSVLASTAYIIKHRLWRHFLAFFTFPICLVNFIIFNLRHNFLMLQPVTTIVTATRLIIPFSSWLKNRIDNTVSLQLLQNGNINPLHLIGISFALILIFTIIRIKRREHRIFYLLMLYYYFGYMVLTFENKGIILGHFVFLLIPLTILWTVSFLEKNYALIFLPLVVITLYFNVIASQQYIANLSGGFMGKSPYSWKSLSAVAQKVIDMEKKNEFGYFVFSPDAYAYQPRYAMLYNFEKAHLQAYEYVKKPVTLVIAAPPPPDDPYMNEVWWIKTPVRISSDPVETIEFPSGYKIKKFLLSPDEQKIPFDKTIELGIFFR